MRHASSDSRKADFGWDDVGRFGVEGGRSLGDGPGLYGRGEPVMREGIRGFGLGGTGMRVARISV
ncbi:MAG: hypothetical protein ACO1QR_09085, partial [Chthoniobacteraceae bacterium]